MFLLAFIIEAMTTLIKILPKGTVNGSFWKSLIILLDLYIYFYSA